MKHCFTHIVPNQYPVRVDQRDDLSFRVTYGQQVHDRLTYDQAAYTLGRCLFHALACNGELDNSEAAA